MTTGNIITKLYLFSLQNVFDDVSILKYSKTLKVLRRHRQVKLWITMKCIE